MGRSRYGLQKAERSVYKPKDLFEGVTCAECGGSHFKFIQETKIGPFPFYVYQCINPRCGNLVFMDYDTMLDHPMSGKRSFQNEPIQAQYVSNKSKLLPYSK